MSSSKSTEKDTVSKLIWQLKSSFRPRDFERVTKTLTARDEAARRDASYWKSKHDAMEKKHGVAVREKVIALDDLSKLKRERDSRKDTVARAENDQQSSMLEEKHARLRRDFDKVKAEKVELESRVSKLESEKEEMEACKSRFDELNRDFDRVKAEKVELESRVSKLESEKEEMEACKSRFDELNRDFDRVKAGLERVVMEKEKAEREAEECKSRLEELNRRIRLEEGRAAVVSARPVAADVAAGSKVVIEIADSDDEMPTGKRSLSKDDYEDVKPTKKKRLTDLLKDVNPTKKKRLTDGSDSSDTDSSSSGSDIDSKMEIERLSRKVSGMNRGHLKLK